MNEKNFLKFTPCEEIEGTQDEKIRKLSENIEIMKRDLTYAFKRLEKLFGPKK